MHDLDEATLMAYADGELDPDAEREVEAALAGDSRAQALARELIVSAGLVRAAFAECLDEPLPKRLVDAVEGTPDDGGGTPERVRQPWWARPVTALAASVALLAVGFGGGSFYWHLGAHGTGEPRLVEAAEQLAEGHKIFEEALENKLSGTSVAWGDAAKGIEIKVTPVRTFRRADGTYCRQYRVDRKLSDQHQVESGLACRTPGGDWIPLHAVIKGSSSDI